LDVDVMLSMPAIVENCFSSGVATVAAIVCGLVPGSVALTVTVGKSTFGRSLTGSCRYATIPNTRMPIMTNVVMTGRLMNSVVKFIDYRIVSSDSVQHNYANYGPTDLRTYGTTELRNCGTAGTT